MKVCLRFEGRLEVDIAADPKDPEAWACAIAEAWNETEPRDIYDVAELQEHEILSFEEKEAEA